METQKQLSEVENESKPLSDWDKEKTTLETHKVYLKELINICLDSGKTWEFINGVLSCNELLGNTYLWYHWGIFLIVDKADRYNSDKIAKDFKQLTQYFTLKNDEGKVYAIQVIGKEW